MKKIFFSILSLLMLANVQYSSAHSFAKANSDAFFARQKEERTKIKKEELPETARKTLEGDAFKGWTIGNVYKMKTGEYEVEIKKGDNTQTIKFNKDGKVK